MPRILASSVLSLALLMPALARADVPPGDAGHGDYNCTASIQATNGHQCAECQITASDTSCQIELGNDYHFVCQQSPTVQIWCDSPGDSPSQSCALSSPPGSSPAGALAGGFALAALLGLALRARRRRS